MRFAVASRLPIASKLAWSNDAAGAEFMPLIRRPNH